MPLQLFTNRERYDAMDAKLFRNEDCMGALARTFQNQGGTAITDQLRSRNETPLGRHQDYLPAEIVGPHFRRLLHQIETVATTDARTHPWRDRHW